MSPGLFPVLFGSGLVLIVVFMVHGVRRGGFDRDAFPTAGRRRFALGLLFFVLLTFVIVPFASGISGGAPENRKISPASAFATPMLVLVFLSGYYLLSGKPPVLDFLKLRTEHPFRLLGVGVPIAGFAWAAAIAGSVAVELVLNLLVGAHAPKPGVSPLIHAIVEMPVPMKVGIVLSAMFFEEAFFRSFLQPRIGAVGATLFFTLAHGVYGEPLMLVGILVLSAVLALTFELYQNALPGIMAHGAFDAFQLFVLIPLAMKVVPA